MKKLVYVFAGVMVCFLIYLGVTSQAPSNLEKFNTGSAQYLTLDFQKAKVKVSGWDNSYVQVKTDDYIKYSKVPVEIKQDGSVIRLENFQYPTSKAFLYSMNTWLPLVQFGRYENLSDDLEIGTTDFEIKVPRNVPVNITAEDIRAENCVIKGTKGNQAQLNSCSTAGGYVAEGESVSLRDSKIGADSVFKSYKLEIRGGEMESAVLHIDNQKKKLEAEMRDVKGKAVTLDAAEYNDLSVVIRDCSLDSLTINSPKEYGEITLVRGDIKQINNNSKLEIVKKRRQ